MKKVSLFILAVLFLSQAIGQTWTQKQELIASDQRGIALFGYSVSLDEDHAIIGAYRDSGNAPGVYWSAGAAYIFEKDMMGNWNEAQKIAPSDPGRGDEFGNSVAISGNYAVVGTMMDAHDENGGDSIFWAGSAYFFERDASGTWNQVQKVVASDRAERDFFGYYVAIDGDYAVITAPFESENATGGGTQNAAGSAYIFERDVSGNWIEVQKITHRVRFFDDWFGWSASMDGNTVLIGAIGQRQAAGGGGTMNFAGAAFIFERDANGTWSEVQKLTPADRKAQDQFGVSVSIDGDYCVVGAFAVDKNIGGMLSENVGAAYIFKKDGNGNWVEEQKLEASDGEKDDEFGSAVSISGNHAVVGTFADFDTGPGGGFFGGYGAAYVFKNNGGGIWSETQKLTLTVGSPNSESEFARSVAIHDGTILAGAPGHGLSGTSYIFEAQPGMGIAESAFGSTLTAYPNPTSGNLTLELDQVQQQITIKVTTLTGQLISSEKFNSTDKIEMEIEGPTGMYFVNIQTQGNDPVSVKLLKNQ